MGVAIPVVPQVVTYVNEMDALNLTCKSAITSSAALVLGQSWLDPHGINISASSDISLPFVIRTATGNYTCVTQLVSNANLINSVKASTQVIVYCKCHPYVGDSFLCSPCSLRP